jgi:hypothetical protein
MMASGSKELILVHVTRLELETSPLASSWRIAFLNLVLVRYRISLLLLLSTSNLTRRQNLQANSEDPC